MGQQSLRIERAPRRLLIVDGFAGPGRYTGGEPGSPLIMLDALTTHSAMARLSDVTFLFLFIEQDGRRVEHLRSEVGTLNLPPNAEVRIVQGRFEDEFGSLISDLGTSGRSPAPTFAFIDPFGYSTASMSLTGRFLTFPRSEALFFLPLSFIHRFVGREGQETALTALFDSEDWRHAIPMDGEARRVFLLDLFERQLRAQGQVRHVNSFQLRTLDGNDYRLVFATGHDRGLEAMWKVDPVAGTSYVARTQTGQQVLFQPTVDTAPLLAELRDTFDGNWFTVAEAVQSLVRSPFLASRHLRRQTLVPAERAGIIEVRRPQNCRAGAFTDDVAIRFSE